MKAKAYIATAGLLLTSYSQSSAALMDLSASYSEYSEWSQMVSSVANYYGINTGSYFTATDWTYTSSGTEATFGPQNMGADASWGQFGKTVTTPTGGGYFASSGIYTGNNPTEFYLEKADNGMVVTNVVMQIEIFSDIGLTGITLSYNGGNQQLNPIELGISSETADAGFGEGTNDSIAFQWDLSSLGEDVNSYRIDFGTGAHASITDIRLASDDGTFSALSIPEPSSSALLILSCASGLFFRRRA